MLLSDVVNNVLTYDTDGILVHEMTVCPVLTIGHGEFHRNGFYTTNVNGQMVATFGDEKLCFIVPDDMIDAVDEDEWDGLVLPTQGFWKLRDALNILRCHLNDVRSSQTIAH